MHSYDPSIPPIEFDQVRIRNPKVEDIGDVIADNSSLENQFLFDEKDVYMQIVDPERTFEFINDLSPYNVLHVMIREFDPETWQFGPIYEVKLDKSLQASKFASLIQEHIFPHIPAANLFCSKVSSTQIKNFKRGDLVLRKWSCLKSQHIWLGQSTLEVNRDSIYIIVKDSSKKLREELTDEELMLYASGEFLEHIARKQNRDGINFSKRDILFETAQANKVDLTKNRRPERGIKINVGGPIAST